MKNLNKIHTDFTLNGRSFNSVNNLLAFSKTISVDVHSFLTDWFSDVAIVAVKTSGSTGTPKIIALKKEYMINSALATGKFFKLTENTKALLCLSLNNIASKMMLVRALVLGWHLDIVAPKSNPLDGITNTYDFCAMVPMQVQSSLEQLNQIKTLIIGGASIDKFLLQQLQDLKTQVFATYGMTETITHIALKRVNGGFKQNKKALLRGTSTQFITTCYELLPNIKISKDTRGCLVIEASKISDTPIITNDLVDIVDATHFNWLGRFDTIINSGGIKIISEEVERKLAQIMPFRFFITGLPDRLLGQKVVLVCEGEPQDIDKRIIEKSLSKYEYPKQIVFIDRFVETLTQKVNRKETLKLISI